MKLQFSNSSVTLDAAAGDAEPRISGIAAPYGVDAEVSTGQRVRIAAGALPTDGKMPRLIVEHDTSRVVGVVAMAGKRLATTARAASTKMRLAFYILTSEFIPTSPSPSPTSTRQSPS